MKSLGTPRLAIGKLVLALLIVVSVCAVAAEDAEVEKDRDMEKNRIQIYKENPRYWQYKGEPILLIGGSVEGQSVSDSESQRTP